MRVSILMIAVAIGLANANTTHVPIDKMKSKDTESSALDGSTMDSTLDEGIEGTALDEGTRDPTLDEGTEMMYVNRDGSRINCIRILGKNIKVCDKSINVTIPRSGVKDLEIGEPHSNQGKEDMVSSGDSALDEGTEGSVLDEGTKDHVLDEGTEDPTLDEGTDGSGMGEATMDTNELMIEMEDNKANSRGYCFRQCKGSGNARKCKCTPPGCGKCDT